MHSEFHLNWRESRAQASILADGESNECDLRELCGVKCILSEKRTSLSLMITLNLDI